MGKRKKLYQWRRMLALILALAMAVSMAPATVYAAPDESAWSTEADIGTGDSGNAEPEEPAGAEGSGSMEPKEPTGAEDTETGDSGNAEPEEPAGAEDSGNTEPEEPGGTEESGNTEPEEPGETEDTGNEVPEQQDGLIYDETESEVSLSENTLLLAAEETPSDENIITSGIGYDNNENLTWTLYKNGELVVKGMGEFAAYDQAPSWYEYHDKIKSARVEVTGATCAVGMFGGCTNLKTVDLQGFDTSSITNMYAMFVGCTSLKSIDLSGFHTENVRDMTGMFASCSALTTLDLSSFHTQQVEHMEYMFQECSALTVLNLSSFDTAQTTSFDRMFYGCEALETLDISGFTISSGANVSDIFNGCDSLKEIRTPSQTGRSVELPETDGTCSWRTTDGTKVTELPAGTTVSTDKKIGVGFTGSNFTLKEFGDTKIEDIEVIFDKGAKESFTFTIVPDEGYSVTPTVEIITNLSRITVTQGETPYQYTVAPKDAGQGYLKDETIKIRVAKPETHTLLFPSILEYTGLYYSQIYESIVVANGDNVTDLTSRLSEDQFQSAAIEVSGELDTTVYVREYDKPVMYIRYEDSDSDNKTVKGEMQVDSPTEMDTQYLQEGYCVLRLGKIYDNVEIRYMESVFSYSVNFITDNLPEGCHIVGYLEDPDSWGKYEEFECSGEMILDSDDTFYIQPKWTEGQDAYRWCWPQVLKNSSIYNDSWYWNQLEPRTERGIEGKVYSIGYGKEDRGNHIKIKIILRPYEIELEYPKGDLTDLAVSDGSKISEDGNKLEVTGGDSLSMSFGLNGDLTLKGVSVNGAELTENGLVSLQNDGDNKWKITVNDMSKLYDISRIRFDINDELKRISLGDSQNTVSVRANFGKANVYKGEPIYAKGVSVQVNGEKLIKDADYTISYRNNINAGNRAELIISAAEDSTKYRGEYTQYFTIDKAVSYSFSVPETQFNVEAWMPDIDLSGFTINATYDKNVRPTGYEVVSCELGGIFAEYPAVADDGHTLFCFLREDADRNSEPAKVKLRATMQNYRDKEFVISVHLVKREQLVLGGELTGDKVYDGRASYPDTSKLQIPYKFPYLENPKEGETVNAEEVSAEEAAKIREEISGALTYHYTGTDGTVYDDYEPPVDVGAYKLQVKVAEENEYYKSDYFEAGTFKITARDAVLTAEDVTLYLNDTIPARYDYTVSGLAYNDAVSTDPVVSCAITSTAAAGEYPVQINVAGVRITNAAGKDVTADYRIAGTAGTFRVVEAKPGSCAVTFDLMGKGTDIRRSGIEAGSLISRPADPAAAGYVFHGWYVDETFSKMWDFAVDTIQKDTRLYAGWSSGENPDLELHVREILPQTYTGKALKPAIDVYAADGKTLLRKNKDYSIAYKNNVDADTKKFSGKAIPDGGIGASVTDTESGFDPGLAYVIITGKGNYKGTVFMNFHINPADISGAGMTLKYTESFEEKSGKNATIVTQLKSKTASLKYGRDYALTVKKPDGTAVGLTDKGQLPLNAGTYRLTIEGKDNYTGSVEKDLYVAAKENLIKNAKVKCAATVPDATKEQLQAGISPKNLEVTLYGTPLTEGTDFEVICIGNHEIGTATVMVKGIGGYLGSKSITFKIRGVTFREKEFGAVSVQDMTYTGTAQTQNDVVLAKNGKNLIYGEDYIISYKNNIKKGRATMTFTANPASGYSGSFKKTFKINPLSLDSEDILLDGAERNAGNTRWTLSQSVPYQKGGATPAGELAVRLRASKALLAAGRDYSIKYKDNKDVSSGAAYMTLTGRGNFTGSVTVYFDIRKASLAELYEEKRVTITSKAMKASMSYTRRWDSDMEDWDKTLKDPDYRFQPAVTVKDGKKVLKKDEDYKVTYSGNVRNQLEYGNGTPQATIIGIGNYSGTFSTQDLPVTIPLSIYNTALSGSRVYVVYDANTDYTYTGKPITPKVTVYYGKAADVSRAKRNGETDESVLIQDTEDMEPEEAYGLTKLREYADGSGDYILSYGPNTAKGKTGKVIIRGVYDYSGSVTSTFTIDPKAIYTIYEDPEPDPEPDPEE